MTHIIERQIPFKTDVFEDIKKLAEADSRTFKAQASVLIEEAVAQRKQDNATKTAQ